jgi:hypothetical protein
MRVAKILVVGRRASRGSDPKVYGSDETGITALVSGGFWLEARFGR